MADRISLIEGSSTAPETIAAVRAAIHPRETVLVILDSNHSRDHVAAELALYAPLVTSGSYIVACDGIMAQVAGAPRTEPDWNWNNPISAIDAFLAGSEEFRAGGAVLGLQRRQCPLPRHLLAEMLPAADRAMKAVHAGRRQGNPDQRGVASAAETDDRDRRPADPVAHHEHLFVAWRERLRHRPRLPRQHDQGVFRQLRAAFVGRDGGCAGAARSPTTRTMPSHGASPWSTPARIP